MPLRAEDQAEQHRIDAAAPADVGGMAAAYYEATPLSVTPEDLTAEPRGISVEQLLAERAAADRADFEAGC